jgi:hypothetical protein
MIKIKWLAGIAVAALSASMLLTACVRERDYNIELAKDETIGDFVYSDAFHIVCDASTKSSGETLSNYKTTGYCATLTHDSLSNPKLLVVDFGSVNCLCNDSRTRRGKIVVNYTAAEFADSGNVISFNFEDFYVNDIRVMGSQVIENKGKNILGHTYFTQMTEGKLLKADTTIKDTLFWNAEREITWMEGEGTTIWGDDVYETVGTGYGWGVRREYYAMNITKPLVREVMCKYLKAGKIELQPQSKALRTIDYGNGECDKEASIEINAKRFSIDLD